MHKCLPEVADQTNGRRMWRIQHAPPASNYRQRAALLVGGEHVEPPGRLGAATPERSAAAECFLKNGTSGGVCATVFSRGEKHSKKHGTSHPNRGGCVFLSNAPGSFAFTDPLLVCLFWETCEAVSHH